MTDGELTSMMKHGGWKVKCKNCETLHDLTKSRIDGKYFRCGNCKHFVFFNTNLVYKDSINGSTVHYSLREEDKK